MNTVPQISCPSCEQLNPYTAAKCKKCGESLVFKTGRESKSSTTDQVLPGLTSTHLHSNLGVQPKGAISGPGASVQKQASAAWNARDYQAALPLYSKVIELGLDSEYDMSLMHSSLGQVHIQLGNIRDAVDQFHACLALENRAARATWQALMYISYIYQAAKMPNDASAALEKAREVNLNLAHRSNIKSEVHAKVQQWYSRGCP